MSTWNPHISHVPIDSHVVVDINSAVKSSPNLVFFFFFYVGEPVVHHVTHPRRTNLDASATAKRRTQQPLPSSRREERPTAHLSP